MGAIYGGIAIWWPYIGAIDVWYYFVENIAQDIVRISIQSDDNSSTTH